MRFKKGSSVEVFSKKEVPTGAWLCAEVMSGNGHTYSVKYRNLPNSAETVVERVPRKAIRPCPSPVEGVNNWFPGDVVEVFHNFSWKMARILKVMDGEIFLVRILGVSKGCFHKSFLRVRQCWQDDKWFVIGKGSEIVNMSSGKNDRSKTREEHDGDDSFYVNTELEMPRVISTGTLKRRSPLGLYDLEAHPAAAQKRRLIEKGSSRQQMYAVHHSPTSEKVDAVVYPDELLGENHMNSSFNVGTAKFSLLDTSSRSDSFVIDCTVSEDTDSCASSSGSCSSMGNDANNLPFRCPTQHGNNMEDYFSDAESSCEVQFEKEECSHHSGKQSGIEFRRSGLDVYRSTIEDLYALGPLSWEDESKLTNLRHALRISDDQHLMLLRNVISPNRMLLVS